MIDLTELRIEEVKVEVNEGRMLQISGERNVENDKIDLWHRLECTRGNVFRRLRLSKNAKMNEINTEMENGVLIVTISEEEVKKPDMRTVEIYS